MMTLAIETAKAAALRCAVAESRTLSEAATKLGISRKSVWELGKKYGLDLRSQLNKTGGITR